MVIAYLALLCVVALCVFIMVTYHSSESQSYTVDAYFDVPTDLSTLSHQTVLLRYQPNAGIHQRHGNTWHLKYPTTKWPDHVTIHVQGEQDLYYRKGVPWTSSSFGSDSTSSSTIPSVIEGDLKITGTLTTDRLAAVSLASNLDTSTYNIISASVPSNTAQLANKSYVDNYAQGMIWLDSVTTVTLTNLSATYDNGTSGVGAALTASGNGAIGTVNGSSSWTEGTTRLLVAAQTDLTQNGIYVLTTEGDGSNPYVLTRASDMDGSPVYETKVGSCVLVADGNSKGSRYAVATPQNDLTDYPLVTFGVDDIRWARISTGGVAGHAWIFITNVASANTYPTLPYTFILDTTEQSSHSMFSYNLSTGHLSVLEDGLYRVCGQMTCLGNERNVSLTFDGTSSGQLSQGRSFVQTTDGTTTYGQVTFMYIGLLTTSETYYMTYSSSSSNNAGYDKNKTKFIVERMAA